MTSQLSLTASLASSHQQELRRAAHVAIEALIDEIRKLDVSLAGRLDDPLRELG